MKEEEVEELHEKIETIGEITSVLEIINKTHHWYAVTTPDKEEIIVSRDCIKDQFRKFLNDQRDRLQKEVEEV